jgi:creatinine amidohydrolase
MNTEVLLHKHTRREFRERMQSGELKACIIPVAAIEQHLEHLAMEHDWRSCVTVATLVAERLRPHVVVAEGLMAGISEHHMKHPGTLSLSPGAFQAVLHDLIDSMVRAGFKNIVVLNGHGGNIVPCHAIWDQFLRRFQVNLHFLPYWDVLTKDDARELLQSGSEMPYQLPGHAQEFETSFALAAFPENVRTDMWTDQPDPTPAMATAAKGHEFIKRTIDRLSAYIQEMIDGRRVREIPPFHP